MFCILREKNERERRWGRREAERQREEGKEGGRGGGRERQGGKWDLGSGEARVQT